MLDEQATANEQFIYEQIKERNEFEHQRSLNLDNKAGNLIGWIGLIISILSASNGILFDQDDEVLKITTNEVYLLIIILVFLICSLFFSLVAFRIREYIVVPEPARSLIEYYKDKSHRTTLKEFTATMSTAIENNKKQNDKKADLITIAWILFLTGMSVVSIFVTIQSFRFTTG